MKIRLLVLIAFYCSFQYTIAQTENKGLSIGFNVGKTEYNGDYGNAIWQLSQPYFNPLIGLSLSAYISPSFDIGIQYSYSDYGYWENETNYFLGTKLSASIFLHYKFNNGYILDEKSRFSPFFSFGIWPGFASYELLTTDKGEYPKIITDGVDLIIPIGAGVKYSLTDQLSIQYQYLYNFTNSDVHDQNRSGGVVNTVFGNPKYHAVEKPGNDAFGEHIFSFIVNVNYIGVRGGRGLVGKYNKRRR